MYFLLIVLLPYNTEQSPISSVSTGTDLEVTNLNSILEISPYEFIHVLFTDNIIVEPFRIPIVIWNLQKLVTEEQLREAVKQDSTRHPTTRWSALSYFTTITFSPFIKTFGLSHFVLFNPTSSMATVWSNCIITVLERIKPYEINGYHYFRHYSTSVHAIGADTNAIGVKVSPFWLRLYIWNYETRQVHLRTNLTRINIQSYSMFCVDGSDRMELCEIDGTARDSISHLKTLVIRSFLKRTYVGSDERALGIYIGRKPLPTMNVRKNLVVFGVDTVDAYVTPLILGGSPNTSRAYDMLSEHHTFISVARSDPALSTFQSDTTSRTLIDTYSYNFISCAMLD